VARVAALLESHSPATGERLGAVEAATAADVRALADRAGAAQALWANVPPAARARYLRRTARALLDDLDAMALLLARETGRPRTEAVLGELLPGVAGLSELADAGPRALADRRIGRRALLRGGRRALGVQGPRGVIGVIGGAASPFTEPALELGAALLAGNGALLAPAAPLAAERLRAAFLRGGIPEELLALAHGDAAADALSGACDRVVSVASPPNGAMLVLHGAALERAAAAALWAAYAAGGHHPASVSRVVCVRSVAEPLLRVLEQRARTLRVGDPTRPECEVGPLRSREDLAAVQGLVDEAVAGGAELLCGGPTSVAGLSGAFYAPAVLRRVPPDARILREPPPGPVLVVVEAPSEATAIELIRDSAPAGHRYASPLADAGGGPREEAARDRRARGAVVSVWAGDRPKGERVARTLGAEVAWVNEHGAVAPGPALRLARHVAPRQLASRPAGLGGARRLPYDAELVRARTAAARFAHGREQDRAAVLRQNAVPIAKAALAVGRELLRRP
jgi:acyl-CoA reductase-like NAD-dependent aldehyde dehydrogenase